MAKINRAFTNPTGQLKEPVDVTVSDEGRKMRARRRACEIIEEGRALDEELADPWEPFEWDEVK